MSVNDKPKYKIKQTTKILKKRGSGITIMKMDRYGMKKTTKMVKKMVNGLTTIKMEV